MFKFFSKKKKKKQKEELEDGFVRQVDEGNDEENSGNKELDVVTSQSNNAQRKDGDNEQKKDSFQDDGDDTDTQGDDDKQGDDDNTQGDDDKQTTKTPNQTDIMSTAMAGMMSGGGDIKEMLKNIDTSGMSMKEKMGLKLLQKLPKKKQEEILRQALNPQELYKHKDKVLAQIDAMVASGQIDKGQAEAVKAQMGLR
jgi:hypothetical protein